MDITYCYEQCDVGKAASNKFLYLNSSAIDAAFDFQYFTERCFEACPYKEAHDKIKENAQ